MSKNGHAHAHIWAKFYLGNRRTWGAHFDTKMFAIDSVDNPVKELFLTCTILTQFEKTYLAFLNILAKCDFLEKITLGPCRIIFEIFLSSLAHCKVHPQ